MTTRPILMSAPMVKMIDGYQFAAAAAHRSDTRVMQDWYAPGRGYCFLSAAHPCHCGAGYTVSDVQHYHDMEGVCHTLGGCAKQPTLATLTQETPHE